MVESAGTAPAASILQGSTAPLCTPRNGVQSQCRPDLPGFSNRCFHWISFLDGELRNCATSQFGADQRNRTAINAQAAHGTPNIPGPRILMAIFEFRSLSQICRRLVGNRGIEPRMRIGAGFTGPLSHQTWRYPKCLETSRRVTLHMVIAAGRSRRLISRVRRPSTGSRAMSRAKS
jgi:hypothetical protein